MIIRFEEGGMLYNAVTDTFGFIFHVRGDWIEVLWYNNGPCTRTKYLYNSVMAWLFNDKLDMRYITVDGEEQTGEPEGWAEQIRGDYHG